MSRISRYQESIEKFIKNKDIESYFLKEHLDIFKEKFDKSNHLSGIILSTIFSQYLAYNP